MDSAQIMSNIKLGGRLSLAYDVLACGVKALPEILLNDSLKIFLKADYKTQFLYQLKATDIFSRIQSIINHCVELLRLVEGQPELKDNPAIQVVDRFLKEQATFIKEQNQWIAKGKSVLNVLKRTLAELSFRRRIQFCMLAKRHWTLMIKHPK
ncbi:MAG TPA: hypothetical protein DD730_05230 [Desulfosporosinus sp.]|nr:hypothetical protein [Desulfosporosinus sp.]